MTIKYTEGYKYQTEEDYFIQTDIRPRARIDTEHMALDPDGCLLIRCAYAWDGSSGPTIQTKNTMRGSLVHDALYQMMREGHLAEGEWREYADKLLHKILLEDGMFAFRAWYWYHSVRLFGGPAGNPANDKPILEAP